MIEKTIVFAVLSFNLGYLAFKISFSLGIVYLFGLFVVCYLIIKNKLFEE